MRVFITGLAGFIGYHTAVKFAREGWEVYGVDNFNDVIYHSELKYDRADRLRIDQGIVVANVDINDFIQLRHQVRLANPDLIIHLAAHAGVRTSMDNPEEYIKNNVLGTQNVIKAAESEGVNNAIYASTSCVMHGQPLPWKEYMDLGPQLSPYGYTKLSNESQFHVSNIENVAGLRFFTVYGPWGRPDMALFTFTQNILDNKPITVYNDGDMKRDFTYIDDIVTGIWIVANNMNNREIYCIGNGRQVELMHFIKEIENNLKLTAEKHYYPAHPADAKETWSDTTKLQALGYAPKTSIENGVKKFVQWYRNYYGRNT